MFKTINLMSLLADFINIPVTQSDRVLSWFVF